MPVGVSVGLTGNVSQTDCLLVSFLIDRAALYHSFWILICFYFLKLFLKYKPLKETMHFQEFWTASPFYLIDEYNLFYLYEGVW